jgi:hypothetical protein
MICNQQVAGSSPITGSQTGQSLGIRGFWPFLFVDFDRLIVYTHIENKLIKKRTVDLLS